MISNKNKIYLYLIIAAGVGVLLVRYIRSIGFKPEKVKGSYKASNCDELHAFQSTHGKTIGNMNALVMAKLESMYKGGINPVVTQVDVTMDSKKMQVDWEVTIEQSKDGKAWMGFTSRGASGSDAITRSNSAKVGQDAATIKQKVMEQKGESNIDFKLVKDLLYNIDMDGKVLGGCPTRQQFYIYTMPKKYPSKGKK